MDLSSHRILSLDLKNHSLSDNQLLENEATAFTKEIYGTEKILK